MSKNTAEGLLDIWIDEIVPCLQDTSSGEFKSTVVFRIQSRSYLKRFQEKNGWHIDWNKVPPDVEVYALALQENVNEIQGLIGIKNDREAQAAFLHWGCTAPWNNKHDFGKQRYSGVGGHLFAIGADKSLEWGYGGAMYAYAANERLLEHYVNRFGATFIGILSNYHFLISETQALKILEVYNYEWNS